MSFTEPALVDDLQDDRQDDLKDVLDDLEILVLVVDLVPVLPPEKTRMSGLFV